jgi:hypothetical protein
MLGNTNDFILHDAAITNETGDDHFPIDFSKPIRFFFEITNLNNRR